MAFARRIRRSRGFSAMVDDERLKRGTYAVRARATDRAGNVLRSSGADDRATDPPLDQARVREGEARAQAGRSPATAARPVRPLDEAVRTPRSRRAGTRSPIATSTLPSCSAPPGRRGGRPARYAPARQAASRSRRRRVRAAGSASAIPAPRRSEVRPPTCACECGPPAAWTWTEAGRQRRGRHVHRPHPQRGHPVRRQAAATPGVLTRSLADVRDTATMPRPLAARLPVHGDTRVTRYRFRVDPPRGGLPYDAGTSARCGWRSSDFDPGWVRSGPCRAGALQRHRTCSRTSRRYGLRRTRCSTRVRARDARDAAAR